MLKAQASLSQAKDEPQILSKESKSNHEHHLADSCD